MFTFLLIIAYITVGVTISGLIARFDSWSDDDIIGDIIIVTATWPAIVLLVAPLILLGKLFEAVSGKKL